MPTAKKSTKLRCRYFLYARVGYKLGKIGFLIVSEQPLKRINLRNTALQTELFLAQPHYTCVMHITMYLLMSNPASTSFHCIFVNNFELLNTRQNTIRALFNIPFERSLANFRRL